MLSPSEGRLSLNSLLLILPITSSAKLIKIKSSPTELTGPVNSVPLGLFFAKESKTSSSELTGLAIKEEKEAFIIDLSNDIFLEQGDIIFKIKNEYTKNYEYFKNDLGFIVKIILNSLVDLYIKNIINLEKLTSKKYKKIHIIGGGCKNKYLIERIKKKIDKDIIIHENLNSSIGNLKLIINSIY